MFSNNKRRDKQSKRMSGGIVFEDMHNRESAFGKLGQTFRHIRYKHLATAKIYFGKCIVLQKIMV